MRIKPALNLGMRTYLQGWYTLTVRDGENLHPKRILHFPNIITNIGLDRLATGTASGWAHVGAGSTAPQTTDVGLAVPIARTSTQQSTASSAQSAPPYYGKKVITYRFAAGTAAGALKEVGLGWANNNTTLFSRALITDVLGNPTTLNVQSDEVLDVTYETRLYPDLVDKVHTAVIGGVTYNVLGRAASVTGSYWHTGILENTSIASVAWFACYVGDIGTILQSPSGQSYNYESASEDAYVPGSYTSVFQANFGLNYANATIKSILFYPNMGAFQFQLTPSLVKTADQVMSLRASVTWARL